MSDYRRLISYIYAYEGGVKGRNIGFAKLEARKGQCKIQVSVRKVYAGGQDVGVYMLTPGGEVLLGKMFLRNGAGEFRTAVMPGNVAGSGQSLDQCYGLTIHGVEDAWRSYTTIWEDAVAHAAELDLAEATVEKAEEREMQQLPSSEIPEKALAEMKERPRQSVIDAIEAEIQAQDRLNKTRVRKPADVADEERVPAGSGQKADGRTDADFGETGRENPERSEIEQAGAGYAGGGAMDFGEAGMDGTVPEVSDSGSINAVQAGHQRMEPKISGIGTREKSPVSELQSMDINQAGFKAVHSGMTGQTPENAEILNPEATPAGSFGSQAGSGGTVEPMKFIQEIANRRKSVLQRVAQVQSGSRTGMSQPSAPNNRSVQSGQTQAAEPAQKSVEAVRQRGTASETAQRPTGSAWQLDAAPQHISQITGSTQQTDEAAWRSGVASQSAPRPAESAQQAGAASQSVPRSDESVWQSDAVSLSMPQTAEPAQQSGTASQQVSRTTESAPQSGASQSVQAWPGQASSVQSHPQAEPAAPDAGPAATLPPHTDEQNPFAQQADYLDQLEQEEAEGPEEVQKLWHYFQRHYPKVRAFDYSGICEVLMIKPQDIGLLPRETWTYGNNSFLLHGYYNHRYLILARLVGQKGEARFLLGVPGHYYSNEKYMASMFGFPNFVLSKMQPAGDGRFGYWYTDIRLGI